MPKFNGVPYWFIVELDDGSRHLDTTVSLIMVQRQVVEDQMLQHWDAMFPGRVGSVEVLGTWFDKDGSVNPDGAWSYRPPTQEEIDNAQAQVHSS